ncbi:MAG: hypothetical protein BMS9Abin26_0026 [Gammaproteobacteria bacterium]|nr:MAG: hypothetical protein BMS9Abin26_0026 [Gammaproteobacteria bacterium]
MAKKFEIKRYSAYFRDWCQAFGEHEGEYLEDRDINWLFGEDQLGLILSPALKKGLYRELLGTRELAPVLTLTPESASIGNTQMDFSTGYERQGATVLRSLLDDRHMTHMYLTYHIMYPHGVRIITFSHKTPLTILYKAIDPVVIELG